MAVSWIEEYSKSSPWHQQVGTCVLKKMDWKGFDVVPWRKSISIVTLFLCLENTESTVFLDCGGLRCYPLGMALESKPIVLSKKRLAQHTFEGRVPLAEASIHRPMGGGPVSAHTSTEKKDLPHPNATWCPLRHCGPTLWTAYPHRQNEPNLRLSFMFPFSHWRRPQPNGNSWFGGLAFQMSHLFFRARTRLLLLPAWIKYV